MAYESVHQDGEEEGLFMKARKCDEDLHDGCGLVHVEKRDGSLA